jgi:DnaJ-class molecular chaperone
MTYRQLLKAARDDILHSPHYYAMLDVHRESTPADISAARKRLSQVVHTDKMVAHGVPVDNGLIALVNVAADTLLDLKRVKLYLAELGKGRHMCTKCKGKGNVRKQISMRNIVFEICPACHGSGLI